MAKPWHGWILASMMMFMTGCQTTTSDSTLGEKNPERAVQLRTQLAAEYIRNNELDKAKNELDAALALNSRSADANGMMGVLLQREGSSANVAKADFYFRRAIAADPADAQTHNNYGTYLFQLKRYAEAIQQFQLAGTTLGYGQRYAALENLGRACLLLNDKVRAEQAFVQALQANADTSIARLELADLWYQQGKITDAAQLYEEYVRLTGQSSQGARALWLGARLARARNDDLGSKVLINQLRAQYPDSAEYQRYQQLQQSTEAVWN